MMPIYHAPPSGQAGKFFDNTPKFAILCALEMNTTFTKHTTMHATVNGSLAICQRVTCRFGVVGTKS